MFCVNLAEHNHTAAAAGCVDEPAQPVDVLLAVVGPVEAHVRVQILPETVGVVLVTEHANLLQHGRDLVLVLLPQALYKHAHAPSLTLVNCSNMIHVPTHKIMLVCVIAKCTQTRGQIVLF